MRVIRFLLSIVSLLSMVALCIALTGCNENNYIKVTSYSRTPSSEIPSSSVADATQSSFLSATMIQYDCDLLCLTLPESLEEVSAGTLFFDEKANVMVTVKFASKYIMTFPDLVSFAQNTRDLTQASTEIEYDAVTQMPYYCYEGYTYLGESYTHATDVAFFYETENVFIKVDFICESDDFELYYPCFKQWSALVAVNDTPTGSIYHDRNESCWVADDIKLMVDPSYMPYDKESYELCLINHNGESIYVWKGAKLSYKNNTILDYYKIISESQSDVEILPNGGIKYCSEIKYETGGTFKSYTVLLETDRHWYFVEFLTPQVLYEECLTEIEEMVSLIQLPTTPNVGASWTNPEIATRNAYKENFGESPAEVFPIYQDDKIYISIANRDSVKTITIKHTVTTISENGKERLVQKDRTKNKSSYRTLPLVVPFEELLLRIKETQEVNRRLCGNCYCNQCLDYIYVNEIGELIRPDYLSRLSQFLKDKGLRPIRFHDLRHSCASLLLANGVNLKDIQSWLGHSTISTTANIYVHQEFASKITSANAILSILPDMSQEQTENGGSQNTSKS